MQRQIEMEEGMLKAHREFMANLGKSLDLLGQDLNDPYLYG
jgi:hypothetical protein